MRNNEDAVPESREDDHRFEDTAITFLFVAMASTALMGTLLKMEVGPEVAMIAIFGALICATLTGYRTGRQHEREDHR